MAYAKSVCPRYFELGQAYLVELVTGTSGAVAQVYAGKPASAKCDGTTCPLGCRGELYPACTVLTALPPVQRVWSPQMMEYSWSADAR